MNKLFTKIATLSVGLAMAIGVGVAACVNKVTKSADAASETVSFSHESISGMATSAAASTSGTYDCFTILVDGIESSGFNASESVRVYKGASITISSSGGNMTQVEFTCTANGTTKYGPGSMSGTGYTAGTGKVGTWTGDAASFTLTADANQTRISDFKITYNAEGPVPVLTSIELDVSGVQTEYVEDDPISLSNVAVTAYYDIGDPKNVTSSSTITVDPTVATLETSQVLYTATYGGEEDSENVSITVNPKPTPTGDSVTFDLSSTGYKGSELPAGVTEGPIELKATKDGSTAWRDVAENLRVYQGAELTISGDETVTSIDTVSVNGAGSYNPSGNYTFVAQPSGQSITYSASGMAMPSDTTSFVITRSTTGRCDLSSIVVSYSAGGEPATYYSVTDEVENGSLDKSSVKEGANLVTTITPDSGYDLPSTVSVTMGGVAATVSYEDGVVTLNNVTGDVVVTATCPVKHGYTPDDPFTVAEAKAVIDSETTVSGAYVLGIISQIDSYNPTYHSIQYWISDDGLTTSQLECYSGKGLSGADFDSKDDIEVGATVIVTGTLKKFNSTYEFDKNNYQYSYVPPVHEDPTLKLDSYRNHLVNGGDGIVVNATFESFSATPTLSVDGTPSCANVSISGTAITITPKASGKEDITFKATYNTEVAEATFKLVVTGNAGTEAAPFTVAEAMNVIDVMETFNGCVQGTVSQVDSYNSTYHSIQYWISDDGTTTSQLECYSGKGYKGANFESVDDMVVNTEVVVSGTLKLYNDTYEFNQNNRIEEFPKVTSFASELLSMTNEVCAGYEEGDNNHDAIAAIWETLSGASYYGNLTSTEKAFIISVEGKEDGSTVEQAMARYDFLTARYELDNFISRSLSSVLVRTQPVSNTTVNTNVAMIAVIVVAVTSLSAIGVLIVVKKRKYHN